MDCSATTTWQFVQHESTVGVHSFHSTASGLLVQEGPIGNELPNRAESVSATKLRTEEVDVLTMHGTGRTITHLPAAPVLVSSRNTPVALTAYLIDCITVVAKVGVPPRTAESVWCRPIKCVTVLHNGTTPTEPSVPQLRSPAPFYRRLETYVLSCLLSRFS